MTRVYTSWPEEEVTKGGYTYTRPKVGVLDLPFRCYEPNRLQILKATQAELDRLEVDPSWIRQ